MNRFGEECATAHHAMMVGELIRMYVIDNDGDWPKDWESLKAYTPKEYDLGWPENEADVRGYVEINFKLTYDEVLREGQDLWVLRNKNYPDHDFAHGYHFDRDLQLIKDALVTESKTNAVKAYQ
ncbi:hypothetical protein KS4_24400 [Poriferisphaera corsica]|uniref:Uncharacterized protein n=1 Tax=Poriferisphaera corsica TaxID=2528020 RepID=A0A517YVY8_9BACT|nr:hypothetical protein [Poriferisphaera corsica]QDU34372.1 hypothetical protein KS4_24400 [Poriferisphaera corsica]